MAYRKIKLKPNNGGALMDGRVRDPHEVHSGSGTIDFGGGMVEAHARSPHEIHSGDGTINLGGGMMEAHTNNPHELHGGGMAGPGEAHVPLHHELQLLSHRVASAYGPHPIAHHLQMLARHAYDEGIF